jgi:hypothetical protein
MIGSKNPERIAVLGGKGNMGRRYCSILECLDLEPIPLDVDDDPVTMDEVDGIIIATPTHTHLDILDSLISFEGPILCEKPLGLNSAEVGLSMCAYMEAEMNLRMVDQYKYCLRGQKPNAKNIESYYNYYNSGGDGMAWDCINIIYHSIKRPILSNASPVWACAINGVELNREKMDHAYIDMINAWVTEKTPDYEHILESHLKVMEYLNGKSTDWDSGSNDVH